MLKLVKAFAHYIEAGGALGDANSRAFIAGLFNILWRVNLV